MCDRCREIDRLLAKYGRFADGALDPVTADNFAKSILELEAEKARLHAGTVDEQSSQPVPIKDCRA